MQNELVSFDNTATAFSGKSNSDLNRAYWLFKILSFNWLVKISPPLVNTALLLHLPVKGLIRSTVFKQFCGGETIDDCQKTISKLWKYKIGTILDYSVEGKETEKDFEDALQTTLHTIERAKNDPSIPFCVFKPSGFIHFDILVKKNAKQELTDEEVKEFLVFKLRIEKICRAAFENHVSVFIDAEHSWIQNVIDDLAFEMMEKFNKEKVIIYNTLQMYRNDRMKFLKESVDHAKQKNYKPGFKIVRGAYMEKERERAKKMNYPSPIHSDKVATDNDYNAAIKYCVEHLNDLAICAGTHNEKSNLILTELMKEKNIAKDHPGIWFSQLYGMSDHISYNLSLTGYNVCKYVPFGPVAYVMPYLIRRAQENTSVAGQTGRELALIIQEKKRRKT